MATNQTIFLEPLIEAYLESQISSTVSFGISEFVTENQFSVEPAVIFTSSIINQTISFEVDEIDDVIALPINPFLPVEIEDIGTSLSILSTANFGPVRVNPLITPVQITPTVEFGIPTQFDRTLPTESIQSSITFGEQIFTSFIGVEGPNLVSIDPTATFGTPEFDFIIFPNSKESGVLFGDVNFDKFVQAQSVQSTIVVGEPIAFVSIGPSPIIQQTVFGNFDEPRPVHRSLIFKNDNITKLGGNDDVEIASNIILKSSTAKLTGDTLPGTTAGFVIVTIDGVDYKMPFFNL